MYRHVKEAEFLQSKNLIQPACFYRNIGGERTLRPHGISAFSEFFSTHVLTCRVQAVFPQYASVQLANHVRYMVMDSYKPDIHTGEGIKSDCWITLEELK